MSRKVGLAALGGMLLLSACGTTSSERTGGGAATGAAIGAGFGALAGPIGALIGAGAGAGAGALTGGLTSPSELNLGTPPWANPDARMPGVNGGKPVTTSQNAPTD
jgi:hypothetical protein